MDHLGIHNRRTHKRRDPPNVRNPSAQRHRGVAGLIWLRGLIRPQPLPDAPDKLAPNNPTVICELPTAWATVDDSGRELFELELSKAKGGLLECRVLVFPKHIGVAQFVHQLPDFAAERFRVLGKTKSTCGRSEFWLANRFHCLAVSRTRLPTFLRMAPPLSSWWHWRKRSAVISSG